MTLEECGPLGCGYSKFGTFKYLVAIFALHFVFTLLAMSDRARYVVSCLAASSKSRANAGFNSAYSPPGGGVSREGNITLNG